MAKKRKVQDSGEGYWDEEEGFDEDEAKLRPKDLYRLLKQKMVWAQEEQEELKESLETLDRRRREAWVKKEMLLDRVLKTELGEEEAKKVSLEWL